MGAAAGGAAGAAGGLAGLASAATPWVSMGLGAVNIATDLVQASKQKDIQKSAERAAEDAARKQEQLLSQDFFSALQVPTEAYDRAARETTAQVGQAVEALQEGDPRQLAGGIGKVAAAGIAGEAETRDAMAQDLYQLGAAQAQSATNVNAGLAGLEGQRLAGAQNAAAQARAAELGLQQGAAKAGAGILNTGLGMIPSFGMDKQPTGPNPNFQSKTGERFEGNPGASWQAAFSIPDTSKYAWSS
jgi:hypothetical protein